METVYVVGSWCLGATGGNPAVCAAGTRTVCAFDYCFLQHTLDTLLHLCLGNTVLLNRIACQMYFYFFAFMGQRWPFAPASLCSVQLLKMAAGWLGLLSMGVFYLAVLATGIWASRKAKFEERRCPGRSSEITMVGGRNLNILVSILTMTGRTRKQCLGISTGLESCRCANFWNNVICLNILQPLGWVEDIYWAVLKWCTILRRACCGSLLQLPTQWTWS